MKRRDFLRSAGAAAVLPVLPLPAMAAPAAVAPVNAMQVGWAALYARVNSTTTPALLQKWLNVGPEQAQALMAELVNRQIIHAPIAGSAAAVQPMYPNGGVPGMFAKSKRIADRAKEVLEAFVEDEAPSDEATQPELAEEPVDATS